GGVSSGRGACAGTVFADAEHLCAGSRGKGASGGDVSYLLGDEPRLPVGVALVPVGERTAGRARGRVGVGAGIRDGVSSGGVRGDPERRAVAGRGGGARRAGGGKPGARAVCGPGGRAAEGIRNTARGDADIGGGV